ncbi:MAG: hypothetical protein ACJA08_002015 [Cyclobacteriaceae bacterium]|jgi:hypothetical protein
MKIGKLCLLVLSVFVSVKAYSQVINSPYSSNGIGEIAFQGLPNNFAMGELSLGTPSPWHINIENPSLLTYNTLSCFQVGLESDLRRLSSTEESNREAGIGLRYLAISFPVVSQARWVTSFALLPLSSVNYHTVSYNTIDETYGAKTDYFGDGGISQLIWANGFRIYKTLAIGVKASYVFGAINDQTNVKLGIDSLIRDGFFISNYVVSYKENTSYSDFNFSVGASYRARLSDAKFLNFGAIYNLSTELSGKRDTFYERQTLSGSVIQEQQITTNEQAAFQLPISYGFGFSYEKIGNYKMGVDFRSQQWSQSKSLELGEEFRNALSISVGGEYTPNYQSVNNYFARAKYRVGFSYKQSPYILNEQEINDFGINFGGSLPMSNASSLDLGFKFGVRGTTKNGLIRENYFQFVLGATVNDRWFIKRRYD